MDNEFQKKIDTIVGFARLGGGVMAIVGSLICFFFIQATIDANGTIEINGIPTSNFTAKLIATIVAAMIPLLGMLMALLPDRFLDNWAALIVKRLNLD